MAGSAETDRILKASEIPTWTDEADIVTVGFGMGGLCASIEAKNVGADVLAVERASGTGGTTASAAGHFYLGGGTAVQTACGFEDSAQNMYNYIEAVTPDPIPEKIRLYCDQSVDHFDWLEAQGIPFDRSFYRTKSVVQPTRECLIWSGNEEVWPYREKAVPAPRGHKVAFDGEEGGGALAIQVLTRKAVALGVRTLYDTKVDALVADETGRIVGVRAKHLDQILYLRARKGVVLASGGFGMNPEMVAKFTPEMAPPFYVQGSPYDDGTSILLGVAAGGDTRHMDSIFATSAFYPPENLLKGILVNKHGRRFIAEDFYHGRTGVISMGQPDGIVYLILDNDIFGYPHFGSLMNHKLVDGWESVAEMEAGLSLPKGALQKTIADYNDHAARGDDPEFHKHKKWLKPLTATPYAAFDITVGRAVYTGFTLGGLRTSVDAEVLSAAGRPIPGLYAAGACASNIAQDSRGYASGTCLGEASFFGRRAGRHAAQSAAHPRDAKATSGRAASRAT